MRVFLVGYMGSGKTTAGKKLAAKAGCKFVDLDVAVEQFSGKTISHIFKTEGEAAFRELEKQCLHDTLKLENAVIATGGGTPCFFDNMHWMNTNGITIYLKMTAGSLYHRLGPGKAQRPLIQNLSDIDLMGFITLQVAERHVFYSKAHGTIPGQSIKTEELLALIETLK